MRVVGIEMVEVQSERRSSLTMTPSYDQPIHATPPQIRGSASFYFHHAENDPVKELEVSRATSHLRSAVLDLAARSAIVP